MKFLDSLQVLLRAFPKWDLPRDAVPTWAALLSDVPASDLHVAALDIARTSKFPPSIAEWREKALSLAGEGRAFEATFAEGWNALLANRELSARQRYESREERRKPYTWPSDAVRFAAEAVGWNRDWEAESIGTLRAQFRDALRGGQDKGAAIQSAKAALEFAPQVEALMSGKTLLPRVDP